MSSGQTLAIIWRSPYVRRAPQHVLRGAARGLEIATLRAIGFGALPVLLSVMIEALLGPIGRPVSRFTGPGCSSTDQRQHAGGAFAQVVFPIDCHPGPHNIKARLGLHQRPAGRLSFSRMRAARLPGGRPLRSA